MYPWFKIFAQPFTLALLVLGVALVLLRRRPGGRTRLSAVALIAWIVVALATWGPTSHLVLGALERQYPPLAAAPADVPALVVLGGGSASLPRCAEAARLYRRDVHTLVVPTGANADPAAPSEAEQMRDWLVQMGVAPAAVVIEPEARSTHENAVRTAAILRARGVERAVLVTDAAHLPRAVACFRKQGIAVVPAPARVLTGVEEDWPEYLVPNALTAGKTHYAVREWVGRLWYWVRGRV